MKKSAPARLGKDAYIIWLLLSHFFIDRTLETNLVGFLPKTTGRWFDTTRLASGKVITKQKLQYPVRILEFLVGAGGFEQAQLSQFAGCALKL